MIVDRPRVVFSALRGNSGKTFLTVGVGACLKHRGKAVSPFKKGPDYIDAAWLEMATGRPCYNLDLFLMGREGILSSFSTRVQHADGALVEGNRGLYDGMDQEGSYSTAELAKLLQAPVILVVDCSMATRTVAATILGCQHFDPKVAIKGVILNRIGGPRHEAVIRSAIEDRCGVPVLGAVPRIQGGIFPERHMGLVPPREHPGAARAVERRPALLMDTLMWIDCGRLPGTPRRLISTNRTASKKSSISARRDNRKSVLSGILPSGSTIRTIWRFSKNWGHLLSHAVLLTTGNFLR